MAPFSEQLLADASGIQVALATLTGACTAGELSLASDSLPFGAVVLGSRTSKRLSLANTGDVGVRFAWDTRALAPHFAISPSGEHNQEIGQLVAHGTRFISSCCSRPGNSVTRLSVRQCASFVQRASWHQVVT